MASKPKSKAVAKLEATPIDFTLLAAVAAASNVPPGYMFVGLEAKPLADALLIEINQAVTDAAGNVAGRITAKGIEEMAKQMPVAPVFAAPAPTVAAPVEPTGMYKIVVGISRPPTKRGSIGDKKYPFDAMPVGGSFFVPATADMPDPVKKISSSVSSATGRYAVPHPTETRTNKAGEIVPKMVATRQFGINAVEDGAPWGFPGVKGAAIFRTA